MTPAARVQAAIDILDAWQHRHDGLDRVLTRWSRSHRFAGSKDRAAIADHVYDAVRRLRSAGWVSGMAEPTGRDLMRGCLILRDSDPAEVFTGANYAPPPLTAAERTKRPLQDAPRAVRLDYPDWMNGMLADLPEAVLDAQRHRAELDLRVNTLKANVTQAEAALVAEDIRTEPGPLSPVALRVTEGGRRVAASKAYANGLVEIQDAASQAAIADARARPGETVLDLCAGGGGKTLALAAAMENQGQIIAHDSAPQRIAGLPERADRAGAKISTITTAALGTLSGQCDLVVVDAPCSGSGAWRRNPDAKWRLTADRLTELNRIQSDVLDTAVRMIRPRGRIAYITCSMFAVENTEIVNDFLARHPGFSLTRNRQFTHLDGADGFYVAILRQG